MDVAAENPDEFWPKFNEKYAMIKDQLKNLRSDTDAKDNINNLRLSLNSLQKYSTLSTAALPPYDIRRSQELLDQGIKELKEIESQVQPKKKFAFSNKNKTEKPSTTSAPKFQEIKKQVENCSSTLEGTFSICDKKEETFLFTQDQLNPDTTDTVNQKILAQFFLKNLDSCSITTHGLLGSVRMENVNSSQVFLSPCCTSVYLEGCADCTIYIACHQLRIHNCKNCKLYVKVQSHPIIEDCVNMGFSKYKELKYPEADNHMMSAGLKEANCWNNVIDFRWHKSTPSPNWFIISDEI